MTAFDTRTLATADYPRLVVNDMTSATNPSVATFRESRSATSKFGETERAHNPEGIHNCGRNGSRCHSSGIRVPLYKVQHVHTAPRYIA